MNIIFVGRKHGKSKTVQLNNKHISMLAFICILFFSLLIVVGFQISGIFEEKSGHTLNESIISQWKEETVSQEQDLIVLKRQTQEKIDALTIIMGDMQARLLRLDALGERLTDVAKLKNGEFDFTSDPALGGPDSSKIGTSYALPGLEESLAQIERQITDREQQLDVIDALFVSRNTQKELFIAGRPITWGWLSSVYGFRVDPFTGKRAWHGGVDFAGKEDSDIIAVASGVVTFSGDRYGYGNLVEVNHGGGYTTRYAHCKNIFAKVGDIVKKGHVIALMGSTGRSTGPHVHYEVRKNGVAINPKKYIFRTKS